jgi:hypothetical protein
MQEAEVFIEEILARRQALVEGAMRRGESVSHLIALMRGEGYKNVTEANIEALGFRIVDGFVGQWTRKGFTFTAPARIVTY